MIQVTKPNAIFLSPHGNEEKKEALIKSAITATTFMPGSLVAFVGNELEPSDTAGDAVAVADIAVCSAGSIHDSYVGTSSTGGLKKETRNRVNFRYPAVGEYVRLIVSDETDIEIGTFVEPGTGGGVVISGSSGARAAASVGRAVGVVETSRYDETVQWVVVEICHPSLAA